MCHYPNLLDYVGDVIGIEGGEGGLGDGFASENRGGIGPRGAGANDAEMATAELGPEVVAVLKAGVCGEREDVFMQ